MYLCLAYPRFSHELREMIQNFRKRHDEKYVDAVEPHWTMIFPGSTSGLSVNELSDHIEQVATNSCAIDFVCRYALVYDDDGCDDWYIFLVPDEGFSQISRLHDQLYSGMMRSRLRLDLPYIPHIGIATSKDRDHLHELAAHWNNRKIEMRGRIDSLALSSYDGNRVDDIAHFELRRDDQASRVNRDS